MFCTRCGSQVEENDNFCTKCGNHIEKVTRVAEDNINKACPLCNVLINNDDGKVICPECHNQYHVACWNENGRKCAVASCGSQSPKHLQIFNGKPSGIISSSMSNGQDANLSKKNTLWKAVFFVLVTTLVLGCAWLFMMDTKPAINKMTGQRVVSSSTGSSNMATKPEVKSSDNSQVNSAAYTVYKNERFGFSIEYPSNFVAEKPNIASQRESVCFKSPDGRARIVVDGGNKIKSDTLKRDMDMTPKGGKVVYSDYGDTWFVVSWDPNTGYLCYSKEFMGVGDGSYNIFTIIFPKEQRTQYEDVVIHLEKTFRSGDINRKW